MGSTRLERRAGNAVYFFLGGAGNAKVRARAMVARETSLWPWSWNMA